MTIRSVLAACALAGSAWCVLGASAAQQLTFRSSVDEVNIDVTVQNAGGPVSGLTAADFELIDNGVAQTLDSATLESLPLDVTLVLDLSQSVDGTMLERLKQSVRDTAALLRPVDRLRLLGVHESPTQVFDWMPGGSKPRIDGLRGEGGTALYDALAAALVRPAEPERRQLVVLLTDGDERLSILDRDTMHNVASHTEAVVDVIVPMSKIARDKPEFAPFLDVTAHTGGQFLTVLLNDPLGDAFKRSIGDFRTGYLLRYRPQGVERTGWHTVSVRVVKAGEFELRARKGYSGG